MSKPREVSQCPKVSQCFLLYFFLLFFIYTLSKYFFYKKIGTLGQNCISIINIRLYACPNVVPIQKVGDRLWDTTALGWHIQPAHRPDCIKMMQQN